MCGGVEGILCHKNDNRLCSAMQKCIGSIFSSENSLELFMDIFMCRIIKKNALTDITSNVAEENNRILCSWCICAASCKYIYTLFLLLTSVYYSLMYILSHRCDIGKDLTVIDFHLFFIKKKLFYHKSGSYLILILPIK